MYRFIPIWLTLLALGCEGPVGPEGPQGLQGPQGPQGPQGEPLNWADVLVGARTNEAVYAVSIIVDGSEGERDIYAVGTGFAANYYGAIWTNAHVVESLQELLSELSDRNPEAVVVRSGTQVGGSETYEIVGDGWTHPDYDGTPSSEDLGILSIDARLTVGLDLLPRSMVNGLHVGQPVGTLGFPAELSITGGDANVRATATFKDGVVSALRAIDGGESQHVEVQYNFHVTGGTSGSPVFDHNGWVVAINHAGPEVRVLDVDGRPVRIALGSLDMGIRVDEIWDAIDILESGRAQAPPLHRSAPRRAYPHDTYQPFPENGNGETIPPDM